MSKIHVDFIRSNTVESTHEVKVLVTDFSEKILLTTKNENDFFHKIGFEVF